jgi:hypothetical protein
MPGLPRDRGSRRGDRSRPRRARRWSHQRRRHRERWPIWWPTSRAWNPRNRVRGARRSTRATSRSSLEFERRARGPAAGVRVRLRGCPDLQGGPRRAAAREECPGLPLLPDRRRPVHRCRDRPATEVAAGSVMFRIDPQRIIARVLVRDSAFGYRVRTSTACGRRVSSRVSDSSKRFAS